MQAISWLAAAALLCGASAAAADQLIQIPTADLVSAPAGEYKARVDARDEGYATLLLPAGLAYEVMLRYFNNEDREHRIEAGGQFQLLPDGVVTPGVSLGVWDLANSSPWGRRAFLVLTKAFDESLVGLPRPVKRMQVTLGAGTGRFSGLLAAVRADLSGRVSLVAEFDARRLNAGVWFRPLPPLTLKAELQNGNPYLGGSIQTRF